MIDTYSLNNLTSIATRSDILPWKFEGDVPENVRKDKQARDAWITCRETKWNCYSFVEGLNDRRRVTADIGDDSNPPHRLHAFVADFDHPSTDAEVVEAIRAFPYKPLFWERTLSGNVRCVWLFAEPIKVPSEKFLKYFLKGMLSELPVARMLPGFDKGAWCEPNRYYTNSCNWNKVDGAEPLPIARVRGWMVKIGAKFDWNKEGEGVEIPFDVLQEALSDKYPRFSEWRDFAPGSQGPTFWVDGSTSPKSAIVRETGIQTFAAHAAQGFYSWSDLLGRDFTKGYEADRLGKAVEGIYYDNRSYWHKLPDGRWESVDRNVLRDYLRVTRRVSPKVDKKTLSSDVDKAMEHIRLYQNVSIAGSFAGHPDGHMETQEGPVLNTYTRRCLRPSGDKETWGPGGNFPFISQYLDGFFDPDEQLAFFLSWLKLFYTSAYTCKPCSGHNVFIAGAPNVGKTLLNIKLVGALVGGSREAGDYLIGNQPFNGNLFEVLHWTVDDMKVTSGYQEAKRWASMLKKMAANPEHTAHTKFKMPVKVPWQGRVVVTCNRDEESIRVIPPLDSTMMDKLMLLRSAENPAVVFPPKQELEAILKKELPHFAQWILDYEIPGHVRGENRFGIKPYHERSLLSTSEQSSGSNGFMEILSDWKFAYFEQNPEEEFWKGTAVQLYKEFLSDYRSQALLKGITVKSAGEMLATLKNKGHRLEWNEENGLRRWTIYKEDRLNEATRGRF